MNSILLVNLPTAAVASTPNFVMPLGVLALVAYLRHYNKDVDFVDLNVHKDIRPYLQKKPRMVGLSVMVAGQFNEAYEICKLVKQMYPKTRTVVGGAHVSQFAEDICNNCPEIDEVVVGEGEEKLFYLDTIRRPLDDIPFIKDINKLPWPAYDLLNFEDYRRDYSTWNNPYNADLGIRVPIVTSRGCPNHCNFCSVYNHMGSKYRAMDSSNVVDMIEWLCSYGAHYFAFYDANFTYSPKRVIDISNEIVRRNLKIYLDLPTGLPINKHAPEMVDALAEAGLIRTTLSIESGDETIRNKVMHKKSGQADIATTVEAIRKHPQIYLLTDFIFGIPEDTIESVSSTYRLIETLDTDDITVSIATPYPGTALYEQCVRDGLFASDIDLKELYKAEWYCHANLNRFSIKPYNMSIEDLCHFRDKILSLKPKKLAVYKKRMERFSNG